MQLLTPPPFVNSSDPASRPDGAAALDRCPHQLLERPFSTHQTPASALHGVIPRHPPPSGRELGSTRRIFDAQLTFSTNFATLPIPTGW